MPETPPEPGSFVVDISKGTDRLGEVTAHDGGTLYLRPPGGGIEWTADLAKVRPPTEHERARIRLLTTPVPQPQPLTYVLSADHGLRRRPEPARGCPSCASLAEWFDHYMSAGPQHDESAAVDCVVEIRNHPHTPPKMTINLFPRERNRQR